jgi:hypothetical protein
MTSFESFNSGLYAPSLIMGYLMPFKQGAKETILRFLKKRQLD